MLCGWCRTFVLLAAAALLANLPCYGVCAALSCKSSPAPASSCHHHKPAPETQDCPHRHPVLAGPEQGIIPVMVTSELSPAMAVATQSTASPHGWHSASATDGSPPVAFIYLTPSVLRI